MDVQLMEIKEIIELALANLESGNVKSAQSVLRLALDQMPAPVVVNAGVAEVEIRST